MLSPKSRINIFRIIPFGVLWLVFSLLYTILERGLLGDVNYYPSTGNPYNFSRNIFITPVAALVTGILIGTIEILYFNKLFIKKSFTKKIVYKSIIYILLILSFLIILTAIANSVELKTTVFNKLVWDNFWAFFSNFAFFSVVVYMATTIVVSQFYMEVSENIGQGVLANFFTGKYHKPTEEERIFMFLDMKSSTSIAESLGHVRYFEMLREYYSDLSDPIVNYFGEIYQYVGDEIVVSWKLKNGLQNNNCIECFFAMQAVFKKQTDKYNEKFGLVPEFKAGFHLGKVTTGEIGVIKKEIIFTGDVLNTTARIQGKCNEYGTELILSGNLLEQLHRTDRYKTDMLGSIQLRGKEKYVDLHTISLV